MRGRALVGPALIHLALISASAVVILPLVWMVLATLKTHEQLFTQPMWAIPGHVQFAANVRRVFALIPFWRYFANSLIVATLITAGDLFFSTLAGFGLAKYRFPGRDIVFAVIVGTMMIPFIVIMIPQYIIVRRLGWIDTYTGLTVPFLISSFGIFMMRQAFLSASDDMIASARIDGAHDLRVLFQIVVPLNVPILVSLAILRFLTEWDSLLWPLVVTNSDRMRTLSLGLAIMQNDRYGTDFPTLMAAALLAIVPVVMLYAFLQRYFIKSIASFGLKE
jgi:ABC-type glycerol-3-phosphate transport system permease component